MTAYRTTRQSVLVEAWQWTRDYHDIPDDVLDRMGTRTDGQEWIVGGKGTVGPILDVNFNDWIVQGEGITIVPDAQFPSRFYPDGEEPPAEPEK